MASRIVAFEYLPDGTRVQVVRYPDRVTIFQHHEKNEVSRVTMPASVAHLIFSQIADDLKLWKPNAAK